MSVNNKIVFKLNEKGQLLGAADVYTSRSCCKGVIEKEELARSG
jgi:hypothetical protein